MKIIWKIFVAIWFLAWTALGLDMYLDTPRQIEKDKKFKAESIDPIVESTKGFIKVNNRLPSKKEFDELNDNRHGELITNIRDLPPEFQDKIKNEKWDDETYAIAVWRGEWNEGYISKNETYILNDYSWTEGLKGLVILIAIALISTILTILAMKKTGRTIASA